MFRWQTCVLCKVCCCITSQLPWSLQSAAEGGIDCWKFCDPGGLGELHMLRLCCCLARVSARLSRCCGVKVADETILSWSGTAQSKPVIAGVPCRFIKQADLLLEQQAIRAADDRPSSEGGAASPSSGMTFDHNQLASLVQSFNELEAIVVAAESLCRSAGAIAIVVIRS